MIGSSRNTRLMAASILHQERKSVVLNQCDKTSRRAKTNGSDARRVFMIRGILRLTAADRRNTRRARHRLSEPPPFHLIPVCTGSVHYNQTILYAERVRRYHWHSVIG